MTFIFATLFWVLLVAAIIGVSGVAKGDKIDERSIMLALIAAALFAGLWRFW